ncbi:hypothetical protein C8R43DRAFT_1064236, partial [Mycena crocata]
MRPMETHFPLHSYSPISLNIEYPDTRKANIVKSWLARSCSCPLSIRLPGNYEQSMLECILAIIPYRARWEYLDLSGAPPDITLLAGPAPLLRQLPIGFDEAPLLRTCRLDLNAVTSPIKLPWTQLMSLALTRTYRSEWSSILRHTENLVHFAAAIY